MRTRTFRKNKNINLKIKNKTRKINRRLISGHVVQDKNGWKMVYLHGNAYDRGYAHGFLLYREIKKAMRNFEFFLQETFRTTLSEFVKTAVVKIKPTVVRNYPEITQEMNGICNGYNAHNKNRRKPLTFDKLLAWNSIMSLYDDFYRRPHKKTEQEPGIKQRCAAFIATGDATKDGDIVMGHSTYCDFVTGYSQNIVVYITPPPDQGFPFVMQSMPGYISSTTDWFICSTGIVGCETTISSIDYTPDFEKGTPYFCRIRHAMQYAQTLDQYENIMTKNNAGDYACSWLFGDTKTGEIMVLELGLEHTATKRTHNGVYYGMNSAIDPVLRTAETNDRSVEDLKTSSGARSARFQTLLLDTYYGKIDISIGKKVLADHYDPYLNKDNPGKRSICSHTELSKEGSFPYYPHGAIDCKLTDSAMARQMAFYAKWGRPCGQPFHAKTFLRQHPEYAHYSQVLEDFPVGEWTKISLLERRNK